ncbi:LacI family DNA-binding transcriptional regulator [Verminephrobacter aporrectodeae]|uniref:LacI family DNA-binding transcriptional regulator n=1 Tax=Verminephrobacter aporrectodeae TaxID=1110389 RepID=UPI00223897EF|nr:LacI family DNA-binding transcriptional regulator [Verminephrobacter aporrectodeae]MCW8163947.1 LacI family transcriptional regulator [Verminephrobacter aporrectodeae subsp. tuberculatae]MCW8170250.1 LacI family transcriptional regulator [Verminephrobacter aporrectodeae subsp. tuberculatae]
MKRRTITLEDVAVAASVSRATAARALSHHGYVGDETATRVQEAADRLGYRANRVAQALRSGQLPIAGFIPGDIQNPFFAGIAHDLEVELRKHGHNLLIASSGDNAAQERELLESLRALGLCGFVLTPASAASSQHIAKLARDGVPCVLIDRVAKGARCDSIVVDNVGGARAAVDYLVANGHRRIGFLRDDSQIFTAQERLAGYLRALTGHGIVPEKQLIARSRSVVEHAIAATTRLFRRRNKPTALFTVDSLMTQGALLGLRAMGLQVPHDVSLIGFDDFSLATFTDPQITVVAQPTAEIGALAARLLIERLAGDMADPQHIRFPTQLIVRGSVSCPPAR